MLSFLFFFLFLFEQFLFKLYEFCIVVKTLEIDVILYLEACVLSAFWALLVLDLLLSFNLTVEVSKGILYLIWGIILNGYP